MAALSDLIQRACKQGRLRNWSALTPVRIYLNDNTEYCGT